nr:uncharacterized protein LOC109779225 [Aegilops tauschii subsp. strangulata]
MILDSWMEANGGASQPARAEASARNGGLPPRRRGLPAHPAARPACSPARWPAHGAAARPACSPGGAVCLLVGSSWSRHISFTGRRVPRAVAAGAAAESRLRGLDPEVVASFPAMTYAEARALREKEAGGKGDDDTAVLECAVCRSKFDDGDQLRLLPKCGHAFHSDCIGDWLAGHVTCHETHITCSM